jgi:hypothetical protein
MCVERCIGWSSTTFSAENRLFHLWRYMTAKVLPSNPQRLPLHITALAMLHMNASFHGFFLELCDGIPPLQLHVYTNRKLMHPTLLLCHKSSKRHQFASYFIAFQLL